MERFERFRFSVLAVPLRKGGFSCVSVPFNRKGRFQFRFRFLETVPAVPVPLSVSGKTVPTVPVSGSSSVPEPPCRKGSPGAFQWGGPKVRKEREKSPKMNQNDPF